MPSLPRLHPLLLLLCLLIAPTIRAGSMIYLGHAPEGPEDHRYDFHWAVLRSALEATRSQWGDYQLHFAAPMNETRQLAELGRDNGRINIVIRETNNQYEQRYQPVRIPIDRGLLSYRVLLIRKEMQPALAKVGNLAQLQHFRIIQQDDWGDVAILRHSGLQVVTDSTYSGLFRMLDRKNGDAFSRGVSEVNDEMARFGPQYPAMTIEKNLLLYYPLPTYFWFPASQAGSRLAARAEQGMQLIMVNGMYQQLFNQHFGKLISQLQLKKRQLIRIDNPDLPRTTPVNDSRLWFNPLLD